MIGTRPIFVGAVIVTKMHKRMLEEAFKREVDVNILGRRHLRGMLPPSHVVRRPSLPD